MGVYIRSHLALLRQHSLLAALNARLASITAHQFTVHAVLPYHKDGGAFVRFSYAADDPQAALAAIDAQLNASIDRHGPLPSWLGLARGRFWLVKGSPWLEDMDHFPSPILNVAFDGPDLYQQSLYPLFRPYGRIQNLTQPNPPSPPGGLRYSVITFHRIRDATIARNVLNDFHLSSTRLRPTYQPPVHPHIIRNWISQHPRIALPVLIFLLGSLTYTIFDPIRSLMVQAKLLDSFNFRQSKLYGWLRSNTFDLILGSPSTQSTSPNNHHPWRERDEAATAIKSYLADLPNSVAFVHGPQGCGKSEIVAAVLNDSHRSTTLIIDCRQLLEAQTDSQLVASLATQSGYWPVFTFLNSFNTLIDLASVALTGQKAGLTSSLEDQLQQILNVTTSALRGVTNSHRARALRLLKQSEKEQRLLEQDAEKMDRILLGTYHDGRLDCVAGTGIIAELGMGDEPIDDVAGSPHFDIARHPEDGGWRGREVIVKMTRRKAKEQVDAVTTLPVVVITNFSTNVGSGGGRQEVLKVLARWAAGLVENQIAHVIVLSDNRENTKVLAKELRSKPPFTVAFSDADPSSAISYVQQKLSDADIHVQLMSDQIAFLQRLGGRASELDSLIHRVRNGQRIEEAVEDIINRGVEELRKNAFGDDFEDSKNMAWTREQAWAISMLLAKNDEVPYYGVLVEFPFKGDENALRSMEHAELITVTTLDGRPETIKPGRPVLRWVFEKLVNDPIFQATMDLSMNEKVITSAEKTVRECEEELTTLRSILSLETKPWYTLFLPGLGRKTAAAARVKYLGDKMLGAEKKIEVLERKNRELRKVLAKRG